MPLPWRRRNLAPPADAPAVRVEVPLTIVAIGFLCLILSRANAGYADGPAALLAPFLALLALTVWAGATSRTVARPTVVAIARGALAIQFATLVTQRFGIAADLFKDGLLLPVGVPIALLLAVGLAPRRPPRWAAVAFVAAFAWTAWWLLRDATVPQIDVLVFQDRAAAALLAGENPYALRMPNIYGPGSALYSPQVMVGDALTFGFPYLPLPLLMETPIWRLAGDVRVAHALALAGTMAALLFLRAGAWAAVACAMLALMPDVHRVIAYGWTEPLMLPWLALTACAMRSGRPVLAAVAFGLFLASKQYCVIFAPLLVLLVPAGAGARDAARVVGVCLATAAAVTLPFVLWDPRAFWHSTVTIQMLQPYRGDALALIPWLERHAGLPPINLGFVALVPAYALLYARGRRTPAGLARAVALLAALFFAFNKQAFLNYYLLVVGALVVALAHAPDDDGIAER